MFQKLLSFKTPCRVSYNTCGRLESLSWPSLHRNKECRGSFEPVVLWILHDLMPSSLPRFILMTSVWSGAEAEEKLPVSLVLSFLSIGCAMRSINLSYYLLQPLKIDVKFKEKLCAFKKMLSLHKRCQSACWEWTWLALFLIWLYFSTGVLTIQKIRFI